MVSTHTIVSGGAALHAEASGAGDPVIFLHAGVADSRMWRPQMLALSPTHRTIAYDRRGFGGARAEPEDHSDMADLLAVADALAQGAPAILVGSSRGGRVAVDTALSHPSRVRGLVLISPAISGAPAPVFAPELAPRLAQLREAEAAGDANRANAIEAHLWLDGPMEREGRVAGAARELFLEMNGVALRAPHIGANLDNENAFARLGEITQPTLLICGDLDFAHVQDRCRRLQAGIPGAALHWVAGAAHLPNLEQPAAVTALIRSFIDGLPGQT